MNIVATSFWSLPLFFLSVDLNWYSGMCYSLPGLISLVCINNVASLLTAAVFILLISSSSSLFSERLY